jgi:hypothetical protein
MARKCSICFSHRRTNIERELLNGTPLRLIAERFGTSAAALSRHQAEHLTATLVKATEAAEVARAGGLLQHVQTLVERTESLYQEAQAILTEAKAGGDPRTALAAIREAAVATREARGHLELLGKLSGELQEGGATTVVECVVLLPAAARLPSNDAGVIEVRPKRVAED